MASGLIILDKEIPAEHLYFEIENSLKEYDADFPVEPYLLYSRKQFIELQRQADKDILVNLNKQMSDDLVGFTNKFGMSFVDYVQQTLPARVIQSDDEVFDRTISGFASGNDKIIVSDSGDIYTRNNPNAKFRSWERGGIFKHAILNTDGSSDENGELRIKGFDTMRRHQLKMMLPFNILIDKEGTWVSRWEYEETIYNLQTDEEREAEDPLTTFDDYTHTVVVNTNPEDWLLVLDIKHIPH